MKIVLGSASARRRNILTQMGYEFTTASADLDEKLIRHSDPQQLVTMLANAKAEAIKPKLPKDALLITADLVVTFKGEILEKPETKEEAYKTLELYKNDPVQTVAAVVVNNLATGKKVEGVDVATIWFKPFEPRKDFAEFIESGKIFDHAGSFAAEQEPFSNFVEKIEGSIDSIAGLPKSLTKKLIEEALK